ncbi:MAG: S1 RNA-binding domain-containing protein [Elusimicrobia bacterium]|jgi:small subunit ribosomal protein S1|nr:S1 RNA-binding domain-containing protein [Elusimicrobiota bacterium]
MVKESLSMEDVVAQVEDVQQDRIIIGTIMEIEKDKERVLVDIGSKSEGMVNLYEFEGTDIKAGDEIEVYIIKKPRHFEHPIILSHKRAKEEHKLRDLENAYKDELVIDAKVDKRVKGGLIVSLDGVSAFMPASLVGYPMVKNLDSIIGDTVPCKIIEYDRDKRNVVVSWRKAIEEDVRRQREELFDQLYPGKLIKGTVSGIKSFGAFINIGGLDGLLHISEISWGHVDKVENVLEVGEELEVKVKSFEPKSNRVALSLKETKPHPWENIGEDFSDGDEVDGEVTGITSYGAFIKVKEGVEGLARLEELSWTDNLNHGGDVLSKGDKVKVKILEIEPDSKRMALSVRQTMPNPWEEVKKNYSNGSVIEGKVSHITDFGAFIMLDEGVEGLLHISDMTWDKIVKHPSEIVSEGDEIKIKVLGINVDKQKISLGLKHLEDNPYNDYPKGSIVEGTVEKIQRSGAYLKMENGIETYLHISNLSKDRIDDMRDELEEGEKIEARVIKNNPMKKQLEVSVKDLIVSREKKEMAKYIDNGN